jgi:peptidoglycan/LPS O-acetylase OafA/YrhL
MKIQNETIDLKSDLVSVRNPNYRSEIQTYRAIAVIAVVLYHATGLLPSGFLGVDVFFVISWDYV